MLTFNVTKNWWISISCKNLILNAQFFSLNSHGFLTTVYWDLDWLYVFIDLIWSKCTHFVYVTSPSNHDGNDDVVRCINLLSMIGDLKLCTSYIVSLGTNARFVVCVCSMILVRWHVLERLCSQIAICWEPKQLENNKEMEWEKKYQPAHTHIAVQTILNVPPLFPSKFNCQNHWIQF